MEALSVVLLFFAGKGFSLLTYYFCWSRNIPGKGRVLPGLLLGFPLVAGQIALMALGWEDFPLVRMMATVLAYQIGIAAVGRYHPDRPAVVRSVITLILCAVVYVHPGWLLPSLLSSCLLQYRVASWPLGPGYSNLLGFEFARSSLSSMIAVLACGSCFSVGSGDEMVFTVLVLHQASYYLNQALAKNALGGRGHEWMQQNRLEHLVGNAWLRGWTLGFKKSQWLVLVRWVARHRVLLCWSAWFVEVSWIFVLLDARVPLFLYSVALGFHLIVFILTGLSCWHFVINHLCLIVLLGGSLVLKAPPGMVLATTAAFGITAAWVGLVRTRIFKDHRAGHHDSIWRNFADASDHLMAWWDSPSMGMFSYTVETASGKVFTLPVTRLSPHDTVLTDIHTHIMILGLHRGLDPVPEMDQAAPRTGVWGLVVDRGVRDQLYRESAAQASTRAGKTWTVRPGDHHDALPLLEHFQAINKSMNHPLGRWRMRWPHFPGEDHVPDQCPLIPGSFPVFRFDESIHLVRIWRVQTWSGASDLVLLNHSLYGEIHLIPDQ